MDFTSLGVKYNNNKLPFSFPGKLICQDFSAKRFQNNESHIFISPVLFIRAQIPSQPETYALPRMQDTYYLFYIENGSVQVENGSVQVENGSVQIDNRTDNFDLARGCGFFASAETSVTLTHAEGEMTCLLFLFRGELAKELWKVNNGEIVRFSQFEFPEFEQRLYSLLAEYIHAKEPRQFDLSRHMDFMLTRMIHQSMTNNADEAKRRKQTIMRALTYMRKHCCEQIKVEEIAAALGFSNSHFSRFFQSEVHQSPKQYLIGLRIARATELLETSDLSVEAIGQECGFNTTAHFIGTFRSIQGTTPLQYRKALSKKKCS